MRSLGLYSSSKTRRVTFYGKTKLGSLGIELGGIWEEPLNGRIFSLQKEQLGTMVYTDKINSRITWGGKVKLTYASGASSGMDRQLLWA
jgi:hypothetical protein